MHPAGSQRISAASHATTTLVRQTVAAAHVHTTISAHKNSRAARSDYKRHYQRRRETTLAVSGMIKGMS